MIGMNQIFKLLMWIILAAALLNGLLTISSPALVSTFLPQAMKGSGFEVSTDTKVVINPALLSVNVRDLEVYYKGGTKLLAAERISLDLNWTGLFDQLLDVERLRIENAELYPERFIQPGKSESSDTATENSPETDSTSKAWSVYMEDARVSNVMIQLNEGELPTDVLIEQLSMKSLTLSENVVSGDIALEALRGTSDLVLEVNLSLQDGKGNGDIALLSQNISSEDFAPFDVDVPSLQGLKIEMSPELDLNGQSFNVSNEALTLEIYAFEWAQSEGLVSFDVLQLMIRNIGVSAKGGLKLNVADIELLQPMPLAYYQQVEGETLSYPLSVNNFLVSGLEVHQRKDDTSLAANFSTNLTNDNFLSMTTTGNLDGTASSLNGRVNTTIQELALTDFSAPLAAGLGVVFESGLLNMESEINIADNKLDGAMKILMRGIDFQGSGNSDTDVGKAVSLNAALSMLKDDDGNLDLDIPVKGDLSDPSFGLQSFVSIIVQKAILSQAQSYLISTFLPYSDVISIALTGADMILRVRFEPLQYQPLQERVSDDQTTFLTQMATMLKDQQNLQIKLCPVVTLADIGVASGAESVSEQQKVQMRELGKRRYNNLKDTLVRRYSAPSDRLISCLSRLDVAAEGAGKMEFEAN